MLLRRGRRAAVARGDLDADLVVIGAGCAGLSLAWHLVERGLGDRRLLLLEPRTAYARDRTWSFWNVAQNPFEDLVCHRWPRWRVRVGGRWIERSAPGLRYESILADAFYDRVVDRLARCPQVELRLAMPVLRVEERTDRVECRTAVGTVEAALALDSRPVRLTPHATPGREITFLQQFEGWRVRTERPVFDPDVVTLMDFDAPQTYGVHFYYVLPYAPDEALVEPTFFGTQVPPRSVYHEGIEGYLRRLGAGSFEVIDREQGVIPMTTETLPTRMGPRVYRLGLGAGMAKPSTGYAFQAIQRYSRELAERLTAEALPAPPEPRSQRNLLLDRVFLSYLARHPRGAPELFGRLFERAPAELLVRFLSDVAGLTESLRVMRVMPFGPMTREVFRSARLWR